MRQFGDVSNGRFLQSSRQCFASYRGKLMGEVTVGDGGSSVAVGVAAVVAVVVVGSCVVVVVGVSAAAAAASSSSQVRISRKMNGHFT